MNISLNLYKPLCPLRCSLRNLERFSPWPNTQIQGILDPWCLEFTLRQSHFFWQISCGSFITQMILHLFTNLNHLTCLCEENIVSHMP